MTKQIYAWSKRWVSYSTNKKVGKLSCTDAHSSQCQHTAGEATCNTNDGKPNQRVYSPVKQTACPMSKGDLRQVSRWGITSWKDGGMLSGTLERGGAAGVGMRGRNRLWSAWPPALKPS